MDSTYSAIALIQLVLLTLLAHQCEGQRSPDSPDFEFDINEALQPADYSSSSYTHTPLTHRNNIVAHRTAQKVAKNGRMPYKALRQYVQSNKTHSVSAKVHKNKHKKTTPLAIVNATEASPVPTTSSGNSETTSKLKNATTHSMNPVKFTKKLNTTKRKKSTKIASVLPQTETPAMMMRPKEYQQSRYNILPWPLLVRLSLPQLLFQHFGLLPNIDLFKTFVQAELEQALDRETQLNGCCR